MPSNNHILCNKISKNILKNRKKLKYQFNDTKLIIEANKYKIIFLYFNYNL